MATSQGATPANLYSGGNAILDAQPFVAFQTNLLAREQAKNEAIGNGYQDMLKGLTPAGMRSQEVQPFVAKVNDLQGFYQQNQDKIKNPRIDNGAAQSEFNSRYNDAMGYAQQSKNAAGINKQVEDFRQKALLAGQSTTDQNMNDLIAHEYPIGDPRHKDFDVTSLNLNPKPLDIQKRVSLYSDMKPSKTTDAITPSTDDPSKSIVTTTAVFSPDDIKTVANRAMASYQSDPSFKMTIDNIAKDPIQYKQYNDLYNHVMGKNFDIGHPEELAFAHDLSLLQKNNTTQKVIPNETYVENQKFQHQVALKGVPTYKDKQDEGANLWTIPALQDVTQRAISDPSNLRTYKKSDGTQTTEYELPTNPLLLKALGNADAAFYNPDTKQYRPIFYDKYTKDADDGTYKKGDIVTSGGQKLISAEHSINPMSGQDVVEALAGKTVGKKYIAPEINSGLKSNQQGTTLSHSREDFKSAGWTDDQINKAVRAGKIKIQ